MYASCNFTPLLPKAGFGTCTILQAKIDKYIHNSYEDEMARMINKKKHAGKKRFNYFSFCLRLYSHFHGWM